MCRPTISRFTLGGNGDGDYGGNRDDAAALAHLEVGRVEPEIRPLAGERALQEGVHPLVDVLAQLGHRRLRDAAHPHRLHQLVDPARTDAGDPSLLDDADQRLLHRLAGFEEAGEVGAGAQLRDLEVERAQPGIQAAVAVAVAPGAALAGSLVAAGADEAVDIGLHEDLQHAFSDAAQEIAVSGLRHQLGKR